MIKGVRHNIVIIIFIPCIISAQHLKINTKDYPHSCGFPFMLLGMSLEFLLFSILTPLMRSFLCKEILLVLNSFYIVVIST